MRTVTRCASTFRGLLNFSLLSSKFARHHPRSYCGREARAPGRAIVQRAGGGAPIASEASGRMLGVQRSPASSAIAARQTTRAPSQAIAERARAATRCRARDHSMTEQPSDDSPGTTSDEIRLKAPHRNPERRQRGDDDGCDPRPDPVPRSVGSSRDLGASMAVAR
jgi:hypothetical protein